MSQSTSKGKVSLPPYSPHPRNDDTWVVDREGKVSVQDIVTSGASLIYGEDSNPISGVVSSTQGDIIGDRSWSTKQVPAVVPATRSLESDRGSIPEPLYSLWQRVASVTIPQSIAVDSARVHATRPENIRRLSDRVRVLKPADLVLVRTPGTVYDFFRKATGQQYDHMGVVLDATTFLHIGPPQIRILPIYILLEPERDPLVLRPRALSEESKQQFLNELRQLEGLPYSSLRVYRYLSSLALSRFSGVVRPLSMQHIGDQSENYICTDSILLRLAKYSPDIMSAVMALERQGPPPPVLKYPTPSSPSSSPSSASPSPPGSLGVKKSPSNNSKSSWMSMISSSSSTSSSSSSSTSHRSAFHQPVSGPLDLHSLRSASTNDILRIRQLSEAQEALARQPLLEVVPLPPLATVPPSLADAWSPSPSSPTSPSNSTFSTSLPTSQSPFHANRNNNSDGLSDTLKRTLGTSKGISGVRTGINALLPTAIRTSIRQYTEQAAVSKSLRQSRPPILSSTSARKSQRQFTIPGVSDATTLPFNIWQAAQIALTQNAQSLRGWLVAMGRDFAVRLIRRAWTHAKPMVKLYILTYLIALRFPLVMLLHGRVMRSVFYLAMLGSLVRAVFDTASLSSSKNGDDDEGTIAALTKSLTAIANTRRQLTGSSSSPSFKIVSPLPGTPPSTQSPSPLVLTSSEPQQSQSSSTSSPSTSSSPPAHLPSAL